VSSSTETWFVGGFRRVMGEKLSAEFAWRAQVYQFLKRAMLIGGFINGTNGSFE